MAVVFTTRNPSRAQYEQVHARVTSTGKPSGLIIHTAGEAADGTVTIVDVWEDQASLDAFVPRLMGILGEFGIDPSQGPPPESYEAFSVLS